MPLKKNEEELLDTELIETGIESCRFRQNPAGDDERKGTTNRNSLPGIVFPDTAVQKILSNPNFDQHALLNCRLVCVQWNQAIINTSVVMRKITFPISDVKGFLNLPIAQSGKVRSIIFKNTPALDSEHINSFMELISYSIQKVEFAFNYDSDKNVPSGLFQLILQKCVKLQEIILTKDTIDDSRILRDIEAATEIKACNKIKYISVHLTQFVTSGSDATGLVTLFLKLPMLNEIKLVGSCDGMYLRKIFTGLSEYIKQFQLRPTNYLKKLSLNPQFAWSYCEVELINLFILCAANQILVECDQLPTIHNLRTILEDGELFGLSAQHGNDLSSTRGLRRPLFPTKFNTKLIFRPNDEELANFDRLHYLNIIALRLIFERDIIEREVNWIRNLPCLEDLILLQSYPNLLPQFETLSSNSVSQFEESFSAGMPSLKLLAISSLEIFESTHINRWPQYFPILNKLQIIACKNIPHDLILQLTVLESLTYLYLAYLPNLSDIAFTADCLNRFVAAAAEEDDTSSLPPTFAPAISCFKSLKLLQLIRLPLLTNVCVSHGIAKCLRLEKLIIEECKNMTKDCLEFIQCEWEFS